MPTVGVPDALRYQEMEVKVMSASAGAEVVLLYDERGIRDQWLQHLAWLDSQLRVKSLQVSKANAWLKGLP